jgi:hypothetical protein
VSAPDHVLPYQQAPPAYLLLKDFPEHSASLSLHMLHALLQGMFLRGFFRDYPVCPPRCSSSTCCGPALWQCTEGTVDRYVTHTHAGLNKVEQIRQHSGILFIGLHSDCWGRKPARPG